MKNLDAYESDAIIDASARIQVGELPFAPGERVRVLVMRESASASHRHSDEDLRRSKVIREQLKGSLLKYDQPFEPAVPPEDWDAISGTGII